MARLDFRPPAIEDESFASVEAKGAGWTPTIWTAHPSTAVSGVLQAGQYYIGDLAYFMKHSVYTGVWEKSFGFEDGIYKSSNGFWFAAASTRGDDQLRGSNGFRYELPGGAIGICSTALGDPNLQKGGQKGTFHDVDEPVRILFDSTGFRFATRSWHLYIPLH